MRGSNAQPRVDLYGDPLPPGAVARLGTVRLRFGGFNTSCVVLPDGKTIATRSFNEHMIRFWDATSGKQVRRLSDSGSPHHLLAMAVSADGKQLAVGSDQSVVLWDLVTEKQIRQLTTGPVQSLAFTPDGKTLLVGGDDTNSAIRVYDLETGKERRRMRWHQDHVTRLLVVPDGRTLVSVSSPNRRKVHAADLDTGEEKWTWAEPNTDVTLALLLPDGKSLLLGGTHWGRPSTDFLAVHDLATGKELRRQELPAYKALGGVLSPDGKLLALSDHAGNVSFWDVETWKETRQLSVCGGVRGFCNDGKALVLATSGALKLVDVSTGQPLHDFQGPTGEVGCLSFSPDGKTLAACSFYDPRVFLWDVESGKPRHIIRGHEADQIMVRAVQFLPDGTGVVSGASDSTLRL